MEDKVNLSWADIDRLTGELAATITASGFNPGCLIGITAGGLIPLSFLAKKLGVRDVMTISAASYADTQQGNLVISNIPPADLSGRAVLLVDEIADTGDTLREVLKTLRQRCNTDNIKSATIAVRTDKCTTRPDFFALEVDRWVAFPWD